MSASEPLRVTVAGAEPLVVEVEHPDSRPDAPADIEVLELPRSGAARSADSRRFEVVVDGWVLEVTVEPSRRALLRERATRGARAAGVNSRLALRAQIPGRVVRVWVAAGDTIETGQRLLAVEAMKMENEVRAPRAGSVDSVAVAVGQTVELGDELVVVS